MYELTVNGIRYENVIYSEKGFIVQETGTRYSGKYNNKYRIQNTHGEECNHTHLNSLDKCKEVIAMVKHNKLPRISHKYIIRSCYRLSIDDHYKDKVIQLLETKKNKGQQAYHDKRYIYWGRIN